MFVCLFVVLWRYYASSGRNTWKSSGHAWRDFVTVCSANVSAAFFLLAAQLLLLWKCFDVDLLEIVTVVACLCTSWPFSVP